MEKDALLEIIFHEIKEVERLIETFRGKSTFSRAFIKLARNKAHNILEEIDLLEQFAEETATAVTETSDDKPAPKPEDVSLKTPKPTPTRAETVTVATPTPQPAPKKQIPPDKPEIKVPSQAEDNSGNDILGETLIKNKASFNELIGEKVSGNTTRRLLTSAPVSDLHKALGINDRFLFQRELFSGSSNLLDQTLDQLNKMQSFEDASKFLTTNFKWPAENEAASIFLEMVQRRFI